MDNGTKDIEQKLLKRWEKDTRYYKAILIKDLFGTWELKRVWGKGDLDLAIAKPRRFKAISKE